jgi:glyoxylase-like metal-dependent hydrolase (beta-lactamase superfamily II)
MFGQIDTESLRQLLNDARPVLVVDVRSAADREQWAIPGSLHVDAYDDLKAGRPSALATMAFDPDIPVVTVCGAGKMSERAADELDRRGIRASSLAGGMKAWSLAWNTAQLTIPDARVVQVRRTGKGCLSYIVISASEALVLDAALPPEVYLEIVRQHGARIRYCADTHIHADHLSRSSWLATAAGAELLLPLQDRVRFPYRPWRDGELVKLGPARVAAIATPGHTMESTCYLLDDKVLFSGDTLFPNAVGRPDLHAAGGGAERQARRLHRSIEGLLRLPAPVLLCPGHASSPPLFDGQVLMATMGEAATGLAPWMNSAEAFVERVLGRIPPTPPNYEAIVDLNEAGVIPPGDVTDLEGGANRCAVG